MKITQPHSSRIDLVDRFLKSLNKNSSLKVKVSLGLISSYRGSSSGIKTLKIKSSRSCLTLTFKENSAIQIIRLYNNDLGDLEKIVTDIAKKEKISIKS